MRRARLNYFGVLFTALLTLFTALCETEPAALPQSVELSVKASAGYHLDNPKGYRGKVIEYEVPDTGSETSFLLEGRGAGNWLYVSGETLDQDDQTYRLSLDLQRVLCADVSYKRFRHFLDHDPLSNQDSSYDADRLRNNILTVEEFAADTALRTPNLPFLKVTGTVRTYTKHGSRQVLTVSKCSQCHVASRNRRVDSSLNDVVPGIEAVLGLATIRVTSLWRDFTEHGAAPRNNYGDASSSFLVRGNAPYSRVPDSTVTLHTLSLRARLPLASSLYLTVQRGERENKLTHRTTDISSLAARLSKYITRFLSCDVFYSRHNTDTKRHGGIDHDRERGGIDITIHPSKQAGIICSYVWESVNRDNAGPNSTRAETYRISYNQRLSRKLRFNVKYQRAHIDDPLLTRDPSFSHLAQTSLPKQEEELFASFTWAPRHNFNLHTTLRLNDSNNARYDSDERQWEGVVSFWYAPFERLTLSGACSLGSNQTDCTGSFKVHHSRGAESIMRYDNIPYDSRFQSWSLAAALRLTRRLSLTGNVMWSDSIADFDKNIDGQNVGTFSDISISQIETSLGITYAYSQRLVLHAQYLFREYNDHKQSYFDGQINRISCGVTWNY